MQTLVKCTFIITFLFNLGLIGKAHTGATLDINELKYSDSIKRVSVKDLKETITSLRELEGFYDLNFQGQINQETENAKFFKKYLNESISKLTPPFVLVQHSGEILIQKDLTTVKNLKRRYNQLLN